MTPGQASPENQPKHSWPAIDLRVFTEEPLCFSKGFDTIPRLGPFGHMLVSPRTFRVHEPNRRRFHEPRSWEVPRKSFGCAVLLMVSISKIGMTSFGVSSAS